MKKLKTNSKIKFLIVAVVFYIIVANFSLSLPILDDVNQNPGDSKNDFLKTSSSVDEFEYSWNASWGGLYYDAATDVATDSQNNVYFTGRSELTGSEDYAVVLSKQDTNGQEEWVKIWDGSSFEEAQDIFIDSASNIFIIGSTNSLGETNGDVLVLKYDTAGNQIWNKTWGGTEQDRGFGINEDIYGNYYITGYTNSFGDIDGDVFLIKYNNQFEEQWNITWGGSEIDIAYNVEFDSNNYIYIAGHSESLDPNPAQSDVFLLKYNSFGVLEWQRDWTQSYTQRGRGLAIDSNDNIYITGYTFGHPAGTGKGFILKYNSLGTYQWYKLWGFSGEVGNYMYNIIIDDKDDLYISGATKYYGIYGNYDSILLNYDTSGNLNWYKLWITNGADLTAGICKDSIGNIYLAGGTDFDTVSDYDMLLIKYKFTIIPEITIITPENKIYTEPMKGYYPATYGFENEVEGTFGTVIDFIDFDNCANECSFSILSELDGHQKVLDAYNGNSEGGVNISNYFESSQQFGTLEWWWRPQDAVKGSGLGLISGSNYGPRLNINYGEIRYYDGSYHRIMDASAHKWYHLRLDFECGSEGYEGLAADTFYVYIDGQRYGPYPFHYNLASTDHFGIWSSTRNYGYHTYFDGIAYSWDPNYNIGDNFNEGLLISYENSTNFDRIGYSLDRSSNITVMGVKVIPLPENGIHSIILNGITSEGITIQSEVRHFTIYIEDPPPPPPPPSPPIPPNYPDIIHIFLTAIVLGIIALLGITLLSITLIFLINKRSPRTSFTIYSPVERSSTPMIENINFSSEQIRFCPICGSRVDNTCQYCANCGQSLTDI